MKEYELSLKKHTLFELRSWLGRRFLNTKPELYHGKNYLNLGCGSNVADGYVNADFFYRFKFWKKDVKKLQWQLDLRYPLNCDDEVFDGIYIEHTLEHLYPAQVLRLLRELYRVLKQCSVLRMTVPDLEKYVSFYNGSHKDLDTNQFIKKYATGCSAIRNISQNWFHYSVWDYKELREYLSQAGFSNIQKMSFGQSKDESLKLDLKERAWETLYVEADKK